jgi:hypothetical protein
LVAAIYKIPDITFEICIPSNVETLTFYGKISEKKAGKKKESWLQFSRILKYLVEIESKKTHFKAFKAFFKQW